MSVAGIVLLLAPGAPFLGAVLVLLVALWLLGIHEPFTLALVVGFCVVPFASLRLATDLLAEGALGGTLDKQIRQTLACMSGAVLFGTGMIVPFLETAIRTSSTSSLAPLALIIAMLGAVTTSAALSGGLLALLSWSMLVPVAWWAGERINVGVFMRVARLWIVGFLVWGGSGLLLDFIQVWMVPTAVVATKGG